MCRNFILLMILVFLMRKAFLEQADVKKISAEKTSAFASSHVQIARDHGIELYKTLQTHESDCFRKATIKLFNGCNSLDFDSKQSMEYAVMLTMCELKRANTNIIPRECTSISHDPKKRSNDISKCIKKLSYAPQTWTTFSGFSRDVVNMCYAIRYPMEKEILERLHENITLNQVRNFEILQQQQDYLIRWRSEEFETLNRLKRSQLDIIDQMKSIQGNHTKNAEQIKYIYEALVLLQNETEVFILKCNQLYQYHVNEMQSKSNQFAIQLQSQLNKLAIRQEHELDYILDTLVNGLKIMDHNMKLILHIQQESLQQWTSDKEIQNEYMQAWRESMEKMNQVLISAHESMDNMKDSIEKVNSVLDESIDKMKHALEKSHGSIKDLQSDINTIHSQIKFITVPMEWATTTASVIFSAFKHVFLSLVMYAALFFHLNRIFEGYDWYERSGLSILLLIVHHYVLSYILPFEPNNSYSSFTKIALILTEWAMKKYILKRRRSNATSSSYTQESHPLFSGPAPSNSSVSSFSPSSKASAYSDSSDSSPFIEPEGYDKSSSNLDGRSPSSIKQKNRAIYNSRSVPRLRIPKLVKSNRLDANDPEVRTSKREFIRSGAPSPMSNHGDDFTMTASTADEANEKDADQKSFTKYNFHI